MLYFFCIHSISSKRVFTVVCEKTERARKKKMEIWHHRFNFPHHTRRRSNPTPRAQQIVKYPGFARENVSIWSAHCDRGKFCWEYYIYVICIEDKTNKLKAFRTYMVQHSSQGSDRRRPQGLSSSQKRELSKDPGDEVGQWSWSIIHVQLEALQFPIIPQTGHSACLS